MVNSLKDKVIDYILMAFFVIFSFCILYPLWYLLIHSLNDSTDAMRGGLYWIPRKFTLDNYKMLLENRGMIQAFMVSIARTVIGTTASVFLISIFAYSVIHKQLKLRKLYIMMGIFTMYFGGGLIPYFLLIKSLGLIDTFPVLILPGLFAFFYAILMMTFFRSIPDSLEESAKIDGANEILIFLKIILPVSTPVIATMVLFQGVGYWNEYFNAIIFITRKPELYPVQTYLYKIIAQAEVSKRMSKEAMELGMMNIGVVSPRAYRIAAMFAVTFPIVVVYPFVQKYLIKGMMIGSVKG